MSRTAPVSAAPATLDLRALTARYGLSRTAVYRAIRDRGFPAPLKLGSRSYWLASEIDAWISERAAERDQAPAPADTDLREARRRAGLASAAARRARRDTAAAAPDTTA